MSKMDRYLSPTMFLALIALIMFGGTACYMWATTGVAPNELVALVQIIVGAFVGAGIEHNSRGKGE